LFNLIGELRTSGRVSRLGFWIRHATLVPLALWLTIVAADSPGAPYDLALAGLSTLLLVSVWGRRLHDRGRSAWWLLAVFVPVLGALALMIECGLRGTRPGAGSERDTTPRRRDYARVGAGQRKEPHL
jgi:uncharacterized membrane protein YhaH (DUF805 family)